MHCENPTTPVNALCENPTKPVNALCEKNNAEFYLYSKGWLQLYVKDVG